jgi:Fe-S cluster assembly protein SufD
MSYAQYDPSTAAALLAAVPTDFDGPAEVQALRDAARARFAETGLPTGKNESWRYTSLKGLTKLTLTAEAPDEGVADRLPAIKLAEGRARVRLVVVNGRYRPDLSDVSALDRAVAVADGLNRTTVDAPGETARGMLSLTGDHPDPLTALNTAGEMDGVLLVVKPNEKLSTLVEIVHVTAGGETAAPLTQPRLLLAVAGGAEATVVEHHIGVGTGPALVNMVTEVVVAENARLRHYIAQQAGEGVLHFSQTYVSVMAGGMYDAFALNLGGKTARHGINVTLGGEGASVTLDGAYMAHGEQHTDTTTCITHLSPGATSREVYKGVVDDAAQAVFQGKIVVKPGAVRTDGHQLNRALLLSDRAGVDAKPELEIYADDVKCSHGCTVGELDDAALFFLRARGIPKDEARALLIAAFLQEAVETIADEDVRAAFAGLIDARLHCSALSGGEASHAAGN